MSLVLTLCMVHCYSVFTPHVINDPLVGGQKTTRCGFSYQLQVYKKIALGMESRESIETGTNVPILPESFTFLKISIPTFDA